MALSTKDVGKLTDEQLTAEAEELAEMRTAVRLRQNEVNGEIELRKATAGLSAAARGRLATIQLEGGVSPKGEAAGG